MSETFEPSLIEVLRQMEIDSYDPNAPGERIPLPPKSRLCFPKQTSEITGWWYVDACPVSHVDACLSTEEESEK